MKIKINSDLKEMRRAHILEVLREHPCLNAKEIAFFIKQKHGGDLLSPQTISGLLRPMVAAGTIGKSNTTGKTVYWEIASEKVVMVKR